MARAQFRQPRKTVQHITLTGALSLAGLVLAFSAAGAVNQSVEHGRELAVINCSRCHAIGNTGESANPDAPPFRTLSERLDVDTIDEALLTRATPAHTDMPHFKINMGQATDIAAYIASVQPAAHGKELVELNCSPCHATGATGDSPHPDAPPFRELSKRYPIEALEEAFVEGIETGHPDMPSFVAAPDQIADIIAYIESVQVKQ
ncbi:MAG: c-type cytochrome [Salaquimonas sp.]|jgi:mono/diheme cytochrome c family protein|nr:c-type cytochrome [Salaquimonas sp.]